MRSPMRAVRFSGSAAMAAMKRANASGDLSLGLIASRTLAA